MSGDLRLSKHYKDGVWLKMKTRPLVKGNPVIRTVDLFSGCGGLALGTMEACRRMKLGHIIEMANEWDENALDIFRRNLSPRLSIYGDVSKIFNGSLKRRSMTVIEKKLIASHPGLFRPDLLTGGPPCQGHSDLNNHSRREDPRNSLYYRMIRAAKVLEPKAIVIENVSTVINSKERVVQESQKLLEKMGYSVVQIILWANEFGVPQKRKRHFMLASRISDIDLSILEEYRMEEDRTLSWAIGDLVGD